MAQIEIDVTFTVTTEEDIAEENLARLEKRKKDKELLEKIKKYGIFDENGEWKQ